MSRSTNGSGKSTLLNAVAGAFELDQGGIHIDGREITTWPGNRLDNPIGTLSGGRRFLPCSGLLSRGKGFKGCFPMKRRTALLALVFVPLLACCQERKDSPAPAAPPAPAAKTDPAKSPTVRLKTSQGEIVIELNAEKAPVTVENFLGYVKKKHYDGTVFHRIIDGFMIQGGGFAPAQGKLLEKSTGSGIVNEGKNGLKNDRGTIAMARTSDLNSATAQFFINVKDNPGLNFPSNGGYAVFGKVISGMEVVDKIKAVATDPQTDAPLENVVILSAAVE